MAWGDFRQFLSFLEDHGQLVRIKREISPKYEVAAGIRKTSDIQGPTLLFENVKGHNMPVAGGVFATRNRCLLALETVQEDVIARVLNAIQNPIEPRLVRTGPCKEVKYIDEEVDLTILPILTHCEKDGGPFITGGVTIIKHPEKEKEYKNLSINREMLKGRNKLGFFIASASGHPAQYLHLAEKKNEPLQVAIAIGVDPVISLSSQLKTGIETYNMSVAGALKGQAIDVVKCETVDLEVPASSEIVIEGEILPGVREMEGPFGEYTGYYSEHNSPVINVQAITHREDSIYQAMMTGMPITENHVMKEIPWEVVLHEHLKTVSPNVKAIYVTPGGGAANHAVISIRQTYLGEAKMVLLRALSCGRMMKHVVIVDDDVDIFNPVEVEWAIAYRFQADDDLILVKGKPVGNVDMSSAAVGSAVGIDATKPFGEKFPEVARVPGSQDFQF